MTRIVRTPGTHRDPDAAPAGRPRHRRARHAALAGLGVAAGVGLVGAIPGTPIAGLGLRGQRASGGTDLQALSQGISFRPQPVRVIPSRPPGRASRSEQRAPLVRQVTHQESRTEPIAPPFSGNASWYGPGFDGQQTASGTTYNSSALTAASKTLPLGSHLQVCMSGCVTVLINDRGPYVGDRVLDLSRAAAADIGLLSSGVGYVTATPVDTRVVTASVSEPVIVPPPAQPEPAPPVLYRDPPAAGEVG